MDRCEQDGKNVARKISKNMANNTTRGKAKGQAAKVKHHEPPGCSSQLVDCGSQITMWKGGRKKMGDISKTALPRDTKTYQRLSDVNEYDRGKMISDNNKMQKKLPTYQTEIGKNNLIQKGDIGKYSYLNKEQKTFSCTTKRVKSKSKKMGDISRDLDIAKDLKTYQTLSNGNSTVNIGFSEEPRNSILLQKNSKRGTIGEAGTREEISMDFRTSSSSATVSVLKHTEEESNDEVPRDLKAFYAMTRGEGNSELLNNNDSDEMPSNLKAYYGHPLTEEEEKVKPDSEMPGDLKAFYGHPLVNGEDTQASALALLHEYQNLPAIDSTDSKIGDKYDGGMPHLMHNDGHTKSLNSSDADYSVLLNSDVDAFLNRSNGSISLTARELQASPQDYSHKSQISSQHTPEHEIELLRTDDRSSEEMDTTSPATVTFSSYDENTSSPGIPLHAADVTTDIPLHPEDLKNSLLSPAIEESNTQAINGLTNISSTETSVQLSLLNQNNHSTIKASTIKPVKAANNVSVHRSNSLVDEHFMQAGALQYLNLNQPQLHNRGINRSNSVPEGMLTPPLTTTVVHSSQSKKARNRENSILAEALTGGLYQEYHKNNVKSDCGSTGETNVGETFSIKHKANRRKKEEMPPPPPYTASPAGLSSLKCLNLPPISAICQQIQKENPLITGEPLAVIQESLMKIGFPSTTSDSDVPFPATTTDSPARLTNVESSRQFDHCKQQNVKFSEVNDSTLKYSSPLSKVTNVLSSVKNTKSKNSNKSHKLKVYSSNSNTKVPHLKTNNHDNVKTNTAFNINDTNISLSHSLPFHSIFTTTSVNTTSNQTIASDLSHKPYSTTPTSVNIKEKLLSQHLMSSPSATLSASLTSNCSSVSHTDTSNNSKQMEQILKAYAALSKESNTHTELSNPVHHVSSISQIPSRSGSTGQGIQQPGSCEQPIAQNKPSVINSQKNVSSESRIDLKAQLLPGTASQRDPCQQQQHCDSATLANQTVPPLLPPPAFSGDESHLLSQLLRSAIFPAPGNGPVSHVIVPKSLFNIATQRMGMPVSYAEMTKPEQVPQNNHSMSSPSASNDHRAFNPESHHPSVIEQLSKLASFPTSASVTHFNESKPSPTHSVSTMAATSFSNHVSPSSLHLNTTNYAQKQSNGETSHSSYMSTKNTQKATCGAALNLTQTTSNSLVKSVSKSMSDTDLSPSMCFPTLTSRLLGQNIGNRPPSNASDIGINRNTADREGWDNTMRNNRRINHLHSGEIIDNQTVKRPTYLPVSSSSTGSDINIPSLVKSLLLSNTGKDFTNFPENTHTVSQQSNADASGRQSAPLFQDQQIQPSQTIGHANNKNIGQLHHQSVLQRNNSPVSVSAPTTPNLPSNVALMLQELEQQRLAQMEVKHSAQLTPTTGINSLASLQECSNNVGSTISNMDKLKFDNSNRNRKVSNIKESAVSNNQELKSLEEKSVSNSFARSFSADTNSVGVNHDRLIQGMSYNMLNMHRSSDSNDSRSQSPLIMEKPSDSTKKLMHAISEKIKLSNTDNMRNSQKIPLLYNQISDLIKYTIYNEPNSSCVNPLTGETFKNEYTPLTIHTSDNSIKTVDTEAHYSMLSSSVEGSDALLAGIDNKHKFATPSSFQGHDTMDRLLNSSKNYSHPNYNNQSSKLKQTYQHRFNREYVDNNNMETKTKDNLKSKDSTQTSSSSSSSSISSNSSNGSQSSNVLVIKPQEGPSTPPPPLVQLHYGYPHELKSPDSGYNESCVSPSEGSHHSHEYGASSELREKLVKRRRSLTSLRPITAPQPLAIASFSDRRPALPFSVPKIDESQCLYRCYMDTPISASQKIDEDKITYLNKGQFYNLFVEYKNKNRPLPSSTVKSCVMVVFRDEKCVQDELTAWQFWHTRQHTIKHRILDIDMKGMSGVSDVEESAQNAVTFKWKPMEQESKISITINCLSTDFSNQKGVKGLPLHIQVDTFENEADPIPIHRAYLQIKIFCDKGAERKARDEERKKEAKTKHQENTSRTKKKTENVLHPPCDISTFYDMADLVKQPVLFIPAPVTNNTEVQASKLGFNEIPALQPAVSAPILQPMVSPVSLPQPVYVPCLEEVEPVIPAKRPRTLSQETKPNEKVLLYVRERHEAVFTALLLLTPSMFGLAQAIEEKYGIPAVKIRNIYKRSHKGILVKMDDNIIRHYSNESTFLITIQRVETPGDHGDYYNITLMEIDAN